MAWLDRGQTGIFQLGFQFGGRRFKRSLRTRDERTAEASLHRVEKNIRLVATGRLKIPPEADVPTFLISDGELSSAAPMELPKQLQRRDLFAHYRKSLPIVEPPARELPRFASYCWKSIHHPTDPQ